MDRIDKIGIISLALIPILIFSSLVFFVLMTQSIGWTHLNTPVISASINTSSDGNYTVLIEDISVEEPYDEWSYRQIGEYELSLIDNNNVSVFRFVENGTAYFYDKPYPTYTYGIHYHDEDNDGNISSGDSISIIPALYDGVIESGTLLRIRYIPTGKTSFSGSIP